MGGLFSAAGSMYGAKVPGEGDMDKKSAFLGKDVRALGDSAAAQAQKNLKENPWGATDEANYLGEQSDQIAGERDSAMQGVEEQGMKYGYNSGLQDKARERTKRGFGDLAVTQKRAAKMAFKERRVGFDLDALSRAVDMALQGSQQHLSNLWNRNQAQLNQAQMGIEGTKAITDMASGVAMGMM